MRFIRQLPWFAIQLAIVGSFLWLYAEHQGKPDTPPLHIVFGLGAVLAFVATLVIVAITEGVKEGCRALARRRASIRQSGHLSNTPDSDSNRPAVARLRELPEPRSRRRVSD